MLNAPEMQEEQAERETSPLHWYMAYTWEFLEGPESDLARAYKALEAFCVRLRTTVLRLWAKLSLLLYCNVLQKPYTKLVTLCWAPVHGRSAATIIVTHSRPMGAGGGARRRRTPIAI